MDLFRIPGASHFGPVLSWGSYEMTLEASRTKGLLANGADVARKAVLAEENPADESAVGLDLVE